jgi:uncharacterized protein YegL
MPTPDLPGGELATHELHFFWLLDGSTSMAGAKVQSLNFAVSNAISEMRNAAETNPRARLLVHSLRFASTVQWISSDGQTSNVSTPPVPISEFKWGDFIQANGETAMGQVLSVVADELGKLDMSARHFPPVIVLVTDGLATDKFEDGLARLMANPFGKAAVRLAVAIEDGNSEVDLERLQEFIGNPEVKPLRSSNSDELAARIAFASRTGIERSSRPSGFPRSDAAKANFGTKIVDTRHRPPSN